MSGTLKIHHLDAGVRRVRLAGRDAAPRRRLPPRGRPAGRPVGRAVGGCVRDVDGGIEAARHHRVAKIVTAIPASADLRATGQQGTAGQGTAARAARGARGRGSGDGRPARDVPRDDDAVEFTALRTRRACTGPASAPTVGVVAAFAEAARPGAPRDHRRRPPDPRLRVRRRRRRRAGACRWSGERARHQHRYRVADARCETLWQLVGGAGGSAADRRTSTGRRARPLRRLAGPGTDPPRRGRRGRELPDGIGARLFAI